MPYKCKGDNIPQSGDKTFSTPLSIILTVFLIINIFIIVLY